MTLPKNWPKNFRYIATCVSDSVHINILRGALATTDPKSLRQQIPLLHDQKVHPDVEMRILTEKNVSKKHPLCGKRSRLGHVHRGMFATRPIERGVFLGEYAGKMFIFDKEQPVPRKISEYAALFTIASLGVIVDADRNGNEMCFVNDYRGIQSAPNAHASLVIHLGCYYLGFVTVRRIDKGSEILTDYGKEFWNKRKELFN